MRRISRHLTYANVMVTLLAFIVLTGGTAVALTGTDTVQSDDLGPGAQVKAPDVAANAVNGSDVVNNSIAYGDLAPAARGARAYGRVSSNGTLSRSKNASVTPNGNPGVYCITLTGGIDPASAVVVAIPDFTDNGTATGAEAKSGVEWDSSGSGCPAGRLTVRTFVYHGDRIDNNDGAGSQLGDDLVAEDEAFAFIVP